MQNCDVVLIFLLLSSYGRKKDGLDSSSESDEDEEARKKRERARLKNKGLKVEWTAHGPFVPNGEVQTTGPQTPGMKRIHA